MTFTAMKKIVSVITFISFIATNSIYAAPESKSIFKNKKVDYQKINDQNNGVIQKKKAILNGEDADQSESQKKEAQKILASHLSDISLIHIPSELGRIVEVYQNPNQDNAKLIVHIQDLHTNPEAEMNLAKILELLLNDYKMGLVCSEGAVGPLDTKEIASFPDYAAREKVGRIFVNAGELTGEEYLAITKYPDLPIWGIETEGIYFKNIIDFNKIMKFNPRSQVFISQAKKGLEELKTKIYTKELLELDQKEADYKAQKIETPDYISYLANYTKKLNIPTADYKNIALLTETMGKEKTTDQLKVMNESQNILLNLQSSLMAKSLKSDSDSLMAKAQLFRDQKISPFSFYSYLKDLANRHLKDDFTAKYPNLNGFVEYLTRVNSLDSTNLFIELENLNFEIKEALSKTDEQKNLVKALRNINFLDGFFNLKVSNEELDYYLNNRDSHKVAFFESFMKSAIKKYNINTFIDYNASLVDPYLTELEEFYKVVKERDLAMVNNSLSEIQKRGSKVSALIAGGFHTKGITKLLKEKGYSYIIVSPYSKTEINEENYHFLLSGQRKPITELLNQLDAKEIINRFISAALRVPLASNTQLVNNYNRDVAPILAELSGKSLDQIIMQPGTGRMALLLSLNKGTSKWGSRYIYEMKKRQDGVLVERFADIDGREKYIINRDGIFYTAKKEDFTGITLAAKPASGDFVVLNNTEHSYEPVKTAGALASNQELENACNDAGISPENLSGTVSDYASIHSEANAEAGINLSIERLGINKIKLLLKDPVFTDNNKHLVLKYLVFGKGSIFAFWPELSEESKKKLLTQMEMVDLDAIEKLYKKFTVDGDPAAEVEVTENNLSMPAIVDVSDVFLPEYEEAIKEGSNAFRKGEVCYLELAGGSGSRLGYEHAKIMLQSSQIMNMSLARMRAKKIRALAEKYGKPAPWLIMTSDVTDAEIKNFFEDNIEYSEESGKMYFGEVPVSWVKFIRQRIMPQVTVRGEFILSEAKDGIVMGGFGHGDARDYVLRNEDIQKWLKDFGTRYIVALNVDNAYIPGAVSVGYHILKTRNLPRGTERMSVHSVEKTNPGERVGVNVLLNGRSAVIEYSQIPDNILYMTYVYILGGNKVVFMKENGIFSILSLSELQSKHRDDFRNAVWVREHLAGLNEMLSNLGENGRITHFAVEYNKETLTRAKLWLLLGNTNGLIWTLDSLVNKDYPLPDLPVVVARNKSISGYNPASGRYYTKEEDGLKADKFETMAFHGFFGNPVMGAFLLAPRRGYFAPIKDAEGKGADTLSKARHIFAAYDASLLKNRRNWIVESATIELSPAFAFLDGSDLDERVEENGYVGNNAKLYLSGITTHIGNRFYMKPESVFILRCHDEYNSVAWIGNNVTVEGNVSFMIEGSGKLIIEDGVRLVGKDQSYEIKSGEQLFIAKQGVYRTQRSEGPGLASNQGLQAEIKSLVPKIGTDDARKRLREIFTDLKDKNELNGLKFMQTELEQNKVTFSRLLDYGSDGDAYVFTLTDQFLKEVENAIKAVPGRIDLKKGPANTKWWEEATKAELAKNPTPWNYDPIVPVETEKGVLKVNLTAKMFENWSPDNPDGRDLDVSSNKYDEIGPLAIAGIRHIMNISNPHDTRWVKNTVERLLTTVALGLMIKIKYNKGAGFPYLANYGHEVRYLSDEFQEVTTRTLAAMGFVCNVVPGGITAIWNTSTVGKVFAIPLSFCGTSSHSPSSMDGLKIMDFEGSQFLIGDIESLIAIKKAIVKHIKDKGSFTFTLAEDNDTRITDQLYKSTNNGMRVYEEYQERTAADDFILGLIRNLDPSKVHIDCMHGSGYRTLTAFFKEMGLSDITDRIDWIHTEERSDFGNIGKLEEDPRTSKPKLFDLGADGTQMFERVGPDGKPIKYFPVLCTADYPEKLSAMPIGDIILPTDMDNDRLYYIQILANDEKTRVLLDETGIVYNVLSNEKLAAVFIPNKSFHFLHEMNFERIVKLMETEKISKDRTMVVLKTLASTPAVDQWVEARKKEGYKIEVINTAVGFAKLANVMYRTEGFMREHPGEDVVITDATGKDINIGNDPIILAAWEESGGIITGITYGFKDLLGTSFLAEREKSATESIFLSLALISKLQKERNGNVNLAQYLKEIYDRDNVTTPIDFRYDNSLYIPSASKESAIEEMEGNMRKNRIFGAYLSIVIAKMRNQISMDEARLILKDIFTQEYEARKSQGQLDGLLIERFQQVNFDLLKDIWFTGDGVMFVFEDQGKKWFVLFRPSGTEPKLKSYGFGKDSQRLTIDSWAFGFNENTKGQLPESFRSNVYLMELWGDGGLKTVDKARRMQASWEDYGLVIDPQDLTPDQMREVEKRKLVRTYSPPDNHLSRINSYLRDRGLPEVTIDLTKPQAMPQKDIIDLLEAIPADIFDRLGNKKEDVLRKEGVILASNEGALNAFISPRDLAIAQRMLLSGDLIVAENGIYTPRFQNSETASYNSRDKVVGFARKLSGTELLVRVKKGDDLVKVLEGFAKTVIEADKLNLDRHRAVASGV